MQGLLPTLGELRLWPQLGGMSEAWPEKPGCLYGVITVRMAGC